MKETGNYPDKEDEGQDHHQPGGDIVKPDNRFRFLFILYTMVYSRQAGSQTDCQYDYKQREKPPGHRPGKQATSGVKIRIMVNIHQHLVAVNNQQR
jgi:hypothetical protein